MGKNSNRQRHHRHRPGPSVRKPDPQCFVDDQGGCGDPHHRRWLEDFLGGCWHGDPPPGTIQVEDTGFAVRTPCGCQAMFDIDMLVCEVRPADWSPR